MQVNSYCKKANQLLLGNIGKLERRANEEKSQLSWLFR